MYNILFIGPYRKISGWGIAAQNYLMALCHSKHNVVAKPIFLSRSDDLEVNDQILELENKRLKPGQKFDIVVQNSLPNKFEKVEGHNIGLFFTETNNIANTIYTTKANILDSLLAPTNTEKESWEESGITRPINTIGYCQELINSKQVPKINIPQISDTFNFYFIGENRTRKNLKSLIIAFNREFLAGEKVRLVIKSNNASPLQHKDGGSYIPNKKLSEEILEIKGVMRLYNDANLYNNEVVITQQLSREEMLSLHKSCHCLVVPSYGESICEPIVDALMFNNTVLCTADTFAGDLFREYPQFIEIPSRLTPVFYENSPLHQMYSSKELWREIDILSLQKSMREQYDNFKKNKQYNRPNLEKFSYQKTAERFDNVFDSLISS